MFKLTLNENKTWTEINNAANHDINVIKKWFNDNLLSLNAEKTFDIPPTLQEDLP